MSEIAGTQAHLGEYSTPFNDFGPAASVLGTEALINLNFLNRVINLTLLWIPHQQYIAGQNYLEAITMFCLCCGLKMFVGKI